MTSVSFSHFLADVERQHRLQVRQGQAQGSAARSAVVVRLAVGIEDAAVESGEGMRRLHLAAVLLRVARLPAA
jgi:hypothetical protein